MNRTLMKKIAKQSETVRMQMLYWRVMRLE